MNAAVPWEASALLSRAHAAMRDRLGSRPTHAARAPGRVNLIGEHTDYNGGFVLPIAIDRICVAVGAPARNPGLSRVLALDIGEEVKVDLRERLEPSRAVTPILEGRCVRVGSWASYVLGVAAKVGARLAADGRAATNVDLVVTSSVPSGSGLSSSASLEVAAATVLEGLWHCALPPADKAALCRAAEHEFAGVPCGIMDQYISAMGRAGHALLIDCHSQLAEPVPMPTADRAVVVVMNTGVHHVLASGEYAKRHETCRTAAQKLGASELRDVTPAMLIERGGVLDEPERKRAAHVVSENARTLAACAALRAGDLREMGRLMNQSHESLRADYEVSCDELDTLVEAARAVPGVFGARMTGGGFGGCAIALAEPSCVGTLSDTVRYAYRQRFDRACDVFSTVASEGASRLAPIS